MIIRRFLIMVALLTVSGLSGFAAAASDPDSTIIDTPGNQANPATDGRFVVWRDYREQDPGAVDIYATDLTTGEIFAVTTSAVNASPPVIDDGIVVWLEQHDMSLRDYDVVGMNLETGERFVIASGGAEAAISGDRVVWTGNDGTSIMLQKLGSNDEPKLLATGKSVGDVVMNGDRIAWVRLPEDAEPGQWQIETQRLTDDGPTVVLSASRDHQLRGMDLSGNILVAAYDDNLLLAFDLETNTQISISLAGHGGEPTTDGRFIVWEEDVDGNVLHLRGYDLQTHSNFGITTSTQDIASSTDSPDLSNGTLVWRQGSFDAGTIHAAPLSAILPTAPHEDPNLPTEKATYFPETGHTLQLGFHAFWQANGGLPTFGFPLTEEFLEQNADTGEVYTVQFTERQRFEYHPEKAGTPYEVLLGRLGAELLVAQGRDWRDFPTASPDSPGYFPETGHAIAPQFTAAWSGGGLDLGDPGISFRESVALFGFPLSEPMIETNADGDTVLTQYFERAVFEYHPENDAPYDVLLRRLGAEALAARGWLTMTAAE